MTKNISDKDKKDWENFLLKKDSLPNKDDDLKDAEKIKKFTFDFHGYSLDEANKKVEDLIEKSYNSGIRKLIIITGKGLHSENEKDRSKYVSLIWG